MASSINPSSCKIFINICIDFLATSDNSTQGIYMIDNQIGSLHPSQNEGTTELITTVPTGTAICWQVLSLNPPGTPGITGAATITMMQEGTSGFSSPPGPWNGDNATWTGQMMANTGAGTGTHGIQAIAQNIVLNVPVDGGRTITIAPQIIVYS